MAQVQQESNNQSESSKNQVTRPEHIQDEAWYPDSEVTNHLTRSLDNLNLENKEYKDKQSICMGNGESITITHAGRACIKGARQLFLNNLFRVPKIRKNLIIISQFSKDNKVYFEFFPKYCLVKDILTNETLLQGDADKGLYKFNLVNSNIDESQKCCNLSETTQTVKEKGTFNLWHYKL